MAEYSELIPYAVEQATPSVAHMLYGVGQIFDVAGDWRTELPTALPRLVHPEPQDAVLRGTPMDIDVYGQAFLGEQVFDVSTYGIQRGYERGVVKVGVSAYAKFGILRGASSQEDGVEYLYFWTKQYQTTCGTDFLLASTTAGQLAFARGRTKRGCLAREIAGGVGTASSHGCAVKVPAFWFADTKDTHRFDTEKYPFSSLTARGTDGRCWVTEVDFSVAGRLASSLVRYNDRLVGHSDLLELDLKWQVAWLPGSLSGPVIPLRKLQVGE